MDRRKRLRLRGYDYAAAGAYLVTICARDRRCVFGEVVDDRVRLAPAGVAVSETWRAIPEHHSGWATDEFVVMPNHVHGILVQNDVGAGYIRPLHLVMATFKAAVSRRLGRQIWQRGFHDRVIRDEDELAALREYIATNPLRWALDRENPRLPSSNAR